MVTMAERMVRVEEQTKAIPRIEYKIDEFIEHYRTEHIKIQTELERKADKKDVEKLHSKIIKNSTNITRLIERVAYISIGVVALAKSLGLW